jgi:hypothetical protein
MINWNLKPLLETPITIGSTPQLTKPTLTKHFKIVPLAQVLQIPILVFTT